MYGKIYYKLKKEKEKKIIYAPNIGAPQYVRQMLTSMKGEINSNTIKWETLISHSHLSIDQLKENQKGNTNFKWHNGPVRPNWYL